MIKYFVVALYVVFLINIGSYALYRSKINGKARLIINRKGEDGGIMTYCLPGLKSNPEKAFKFQERASIHEKNFIVGGITYVAYGNTGFDAKTIAKQIIEDIREHNYQPVILSVSVGDQIARYVEQEIDNLKIVAINPATNIDCLKCDVMVKLIIKQFFMESFLILIGWLGALKLVKTDSTKKHQSLRLATDMETCLIRSNLEVEGNATKAIIVSYFDEILDNVNVYDIFSCAKDLQVVVVDTGHANLSIGSILYRDKITNVFKTIYNTP